MNKNDRLRYDHQVWKEGGILTEELDSHQNSQVLRQFAAKLSGYRNYNAETRLAILTKYPAKNGFIVVFRDDAHWVKGDKPQPEDQFKIRLQLEQIQQEHPGKHLAYFKYIKAIRITQMTGTFAQNSRQPMAGQTVWLNPVVSGQVLRVCTGVPDIVSYVDLRIEGMDRIATYTTDQLFDHRPEVVEYRVNGETVSVWE